MAVKAIELGTGAQGLFLKNDRFNTTLISFNFYLPLSAEKTAAYGLLPFLLTTCSRRYPDFSKLNYKLSKLYGAELSASTEKAGDLQLLKVAVSVINDRFALDGEPLTEQACELLLDLIFDPMVENGGFVEEDVSREKRKAIEHIRGEVSEKRIYAKNRLIEEMYRGQPYGVPKCGTEEQVDALTGEILYRAWREMLEQAFVRVNVISSVLPAGLFDRVRERFADLPRHDITDHLALSPTPAATQVNHVTERMDIAQGKLVLGFSTELYGTDETTAPMFVTSDIFGGGPYSLLFSVVREKMSLCYYCSSSPTRVKGLLTVDSGVELKNADRAEEAILAQLKTVQDGAFDDFALKASIRSLCDSMHSINDSQTALDTWYSVKIANRVLLTPEELAEKIAAVTREDVIQTAKGIRLHTVYKLLPKECAE